MGAQPERLAREVLGRRVLVTGAMGLGKSTLVAALARELDQDGVRVHCISADPGSPAFGVPGALSLGSWWEASWVTQTMVGLCTLDAGRFRLPLVAALRRLARTVQGPMLVDAPGVVRGVAGAELLLGMAEAGGVDLILHLHRAGRPLCLEQELRALGVQIVLVEAPGEARAPGQGARARQRTRLWERYLADAAEQTIPLSEVALIGTPPPRSVPEAWVGRQVAWEAAGRTVALGEVLGLEAGGLLRLRLGRRPSPGEPPTLLVRDAGRDPSGRLNTLKSFGSGTVSFVPPPDIHPYAGIKEVGPCPVVRVGAVMAILVNGVFGDPLLHLRLRHRRRSLLFDLGEGNRLAARIAHQVSDVFLSHAHADHISGFLWLLRSRIGEFPPCRLYGPPGIAEHIEGLVRGFEWDRAGGMRPRFRVCELHDGVQYHYTVIAGQPGPQPAGESPDREGLLREEAELRVRAITLDHHGLPVLAYAFDQTRQFNIRKDRLQARGLAPGSWLTELKTALARGDTEARLDLPDGSRACAGALAEELVLVRPGVRLVYATDLADSPLNRKRLINLAGGAHTLFCESPFVESDAAQAARTGHLTTRACGEIACAAEVGQLVPFHFSRRYEGDPMRVYTEISQVCPRVVMPSSGRITGLGKAPG